MSRLYLYLDVIIVLIVPLLPAYIIFQLFGEQNFASFSYSKEASFGGPIAAYICLALLAKGVLNKALTRHDPLISFKKKILGSWKVQSRCMVRDVLATGDAEFRINQANEIEVSGNFEINGQPMGSWKSVSVNFSNGRLEYIYILNDVSHGDIEWAGRVIMNVDISGRELSGTWEVFGPDRRYGLISFSKSS